MDVIKIAYDGGISVTCVIFVWSDYFNAYIRETSDGIFGMRKAGDRWERFRIVVNGNEDGGSEFHAALEKLSIPPTKSLIFFEDLG